MENEARNLFYCYNHALAAFMVGRGLAPAFGGFSQERLKNYWAFERGQALEDSLDAWQKQKWLIRHNNDAKHMGEAKNGNEAE